MPPKGKPNLTFNMPMIVDAPNLRVAGMSLEVPGTRARDALRTFESSTTSLGPWWGNDEFGTEIAAQWVPTYEQLTAYMADLSGAFGDMGSSYVAMANNYDTTAEVNSS